MNSIKYCSNASKAFVRTGMVLPKNFRFKFLSFLIISSVFFSCGASREDRDLFESSFVRYTYDKNDLTEEEVDQYIILASEVVIASSIQRRVEKLQRLLEGAADNDARISMGLVESINTAQQEYNQCVGRQQKLVNDLKTKRSDRLGSQIKQNASIVNLIQAWKEEESRIKMIKLAEIRKATLGEEIDKLEGMDELKCRILGISKQEILNG